MVMAHESLFTVGGLPFSVHFATEGGIFEATLRPSDRAMERSSDRAIDRSTERSNDRAIERSSDLSI